VDKQHCCGWAFLWLRDGGLRTSMDITSMCCNSLECRRACVSGYGLLLVGRLSSYREIVRGAREFIRWTVKTLDHRG
jgi:hypothetical protein